MSRRHRYGPASKRRTGVFATPSELARLTQLVDVVVSVVSPKLANMARKMAQTRAAQECDQMARDHGLPPLEHGLYGIGGNGEFLAPTTPKETPQ